ncbi:MAG: hypothetical protein IKS99_08480 [Firmicutes bacterium]|nr:hypothetical protein [Bacillota bacterium]
MINIFNRAVLFQDYDPENAAKVYTTLRKAGIEYKVSISGKGPASPMVRFSRGGRTGSMAGGSATTATYGSGGTPDSWINNKSSTNLYTVYVAKEDLTRAKEICEIG